MARLIEVLDKYKYYFLFIVPLIILVVMSLLELTGNDLGTSTYIAGSFLGDYWLEILVGIFVVFIVLWIVMRIFSRIVFNKIQRERDELREKSEIRKLQTSVHRE